MSLADWTAEIRMLEPSALQVRQVAARHRVDYARAVSRPRHRIEHLGGGEQLRRTSIRANHPDALFAAAIRHERDLLAVRREDRALVDGVLGRERTRIGS